MIYNISNLMKCELLKCHIFELYGGDDFNQLNKTLEQYNKESPKEFKDCLEVFIDKINNTEVIKL